MRIKTAILTDSVRLESWIWVQASPEGLYSIPQQAPGGKLCFLSYIPRVKAVLPCSGLTLPWGFFRVWGGFFFS